MSYLFWYDRIDSNQPKLRPDIWAYHEEIVVPPLLTTVRLVRLSVPLILPCRTTSIGDLRLYEDPVKRETNVIVLKKNRISSALSGLLPSLITSSVYCEQGRHTRMYTYAKACRPELPDLTFSNIYDFYCFNFLPLDFLLLTSFISTFPFFPFYCRLTFILFVLLPFTFPF